jgi:hypothetical protein
MRAADRFVRARHPPNALFLWGYGLLRRNNTALAGIPIEEIRTLLRGDDLARQCILGESGPDTTPRDILLHVDTKTLVGPAVNLLTKMPAPVGALAEALHEVIVLDGGGPFAAETALQVVQRVPERVIDPLRAGIFKRVWTLGSQPIDPYGAAPLHDSARVAAAALLAAHVDCRIAALPTLGDAQSGRLRQLIYAASLQMLDSSPGAAFGQLIGQVSPSATEALALGRASDQDGSTTDPIPVSGARARIRSFVDQLRVSGGKNVRPYAPLIVAIGVPLVSVSIASLADAVFGLPHHLSLSTTPLLTVAAVLVAVHVFAAELGAQRLPGVVARGTSVPLQLWSGYLSIGALMLLAVAKPDKHDLAFYSVVGIGLIVAVIASIAVTLRRLLSRTDRTVAAHVFTRGELRRTRRTGRFVGRLNTSVVRSRAAFTALPWVRPAPAPPVSFRRLEIRVRQSGFLSINPKRLAQLNAQDWWHGGARLWLYGVLGSQVEVNDDVASLVPAPEDELPAALVDAIQDLFVVRSAASVDRTAEAVSALIEMTAALGNEGNEQGASHVSSDVARLLREHRAAIGSTHREPADPRQAGAPVAVSRTAALSAVRSLRAAQGPAAVEALTRLIQRSLPGCRDGDPFLSILLIQLVDQRQGLHQGTLKILLEDCGRQSLESRDQLAFTVWKRLVETLANDPPWRDVAIASGSYFVQVAAAIDRGRGETAWEHFAPHLNSTVGTDNVAAVCVGASALVSGRVSLSTAVAIHLRAFNWTGWRQVVRQARFLDYVTTTDESRGGMLGANPEAALNDFITLAEAIATHVH